MSRFSSSDLIAELDSLLVRHCAFNAAKASIAETLALARLSHDRALLPVLGRSRTGKSRLLQLCMQEHLIEAEEAGREPTAVYMALPRYARPKAILKALLHALGYPIYATGAEVDLQLRAIELIQKRQISVMYVDETQQAVSHRDDINAELVDCFKALLDEAGVTVIAAGLPEMTTLLEADEQLVGRAVKPVELPRFSWQEDDSRCEFVSLLVTFTKALEFADLPDPVDEKIAFAWYAATGGRVGYVTKILRQALLASVGHKIGLRELDQAYDKQIYGSARLPRPFTRCFKASEVSAALEHADRLGQGAAQRRVAPVARGRRRSAVGRDGQEV